MSMRSCCETPASWKQYVIIGRHLNGRRCAWERSDTSIGSALYLERGKLYACLLCYFFHRVGKRAYPGSTAIHGQHVARAEHVPNITHVSMPSHLHPRKTLNHGTPPLHRPITIIIILLINDSQRCIVNISN